MPTSPVSIYAQGYWAINIVVLSRDGGNKNVSPTNNSHTHSIECANSRAGITARLKRRPAVAADHVSSNEPRISMKTSLQTRRPQAEHRISAE